MSAEYFVLFHSEGMVNATIISSPSFPVGFMFRGSIYQPCKRSLMEFNHLVWANVLIGFQFLSPQDAGEDFLSSRFVCGSRNVKLEYWGGTSPVLEIYLGSHEETESDQAAALGAWMFEGGEDDHILTLSREPSSGLELGFELATGDTPSPVTNSVTEN